MTDYEYVLDEYIKNTGVKNGIIPVYPGFHIDILDGCCYTNGRIVEYKHWRKQIIAKLMRDDKDVEYGKSQRAQWEKLRE
jgi:hypothetical protein